MPKSDGEHAKHHCQRSVSSSAAKRQNPAFQILKLLHFAPYTLPFKPMFEIIHDRVNKNGKYDSTPYKGRLKEGTYHGYFA